MRLAVLTCAVVVAGAALAGQSAAPTANALAAAIQKKYSSVSALTADFSQERRNALMPQVRTSTGTLRILKPNRMWWEYRKPEPKFWVVDGTFNWDYDVRTKVAYRAPLPKGDQGPAPLRFLAGQGDILRDFQVSVPATHPADEWHLEMRPRTKSTSFDRLTLFVRRSDYAIVGMATVLEDTTTTFRFTNLNERARLTAADFRLDLPKDVIIEHR